MLFTIYYTVVYYTAVSVSCSGIALFLWDWQSMKMGSGEKQMVKLGEYVVRRNSLLGRSFPLCCVFVNILTYLLKKQVEFQYLLKGNNSRLFCQPSWRTYAKNCRLLYNRVFFGWLVCCVGFFQIRNNQWLSFISIPLFIPRVMSLWWV